MKDSVKRYLKVSLTLGLIAGCSALLIGVTNLITADRIQANKVKKEEDGLSNVFPDSDQEFVTLDFDTSFTYVEKIWSVKSGEKDLGFIYKTSGKNSYGNVSLLLGFTEKKLANMIVLENTETYGSTLEENYIVPVNAGTRDYNDVSCGATYGAKLIQNMVEEASADVMKR